MRHAQVAYTARHTSPSEHSIEQGPLHNLEAFVPSTVVVHNAVDLLLTLCTPGTGLLLVHLYITLLGIIKGRVQHCTCVIPLVFEVLSTNQKAGVGPRNA